MDDPEDAKGQVIPYVVKLDVRRLISVPKDDNNLCRAEVCFGQRAGSLLFSIFCLPSKRSAKAKRASPTNAPPTETKSPVGWNIGKHEYTVSAGVSVAEEATPKALKAQRPLVTRAMRKAPPPFLLTKINASSRARP